MQCLLSLWQSDERCAIICHDRKANAVKKRSRLIIFILLNIIISGLTTLVVIMLWERTHPRATVETESISEIITSPDAELSVENPETAITFVKEDISVTIYTVVGAGNLDAEYVEIRNLSNGPVDPAGWQLVDEDGHVFIFPSSPSWVLNSGGAVKILSKKGNNSVIELFWQSDEPIWQSGETAILIDADGNTIATYSIP